MKKTCGVVPPCDHAMLCPFIINQITSCLVGHTTQVVRSDDYVRSERGWLIVNIDTIRVYGHEQDDANNNMCSDNHFG